MQFKDLQNSYQVHLLIKGERITHKMGTVISVSNSRFPPLQPGQMPYQQPQVSFQQPQDRIVDLEVSVDGINTTYVVRENMTVEVRNGITISCDKEPIINEINAIARECNSAINGVDKQKERLKDCEAIMAELNPASLMDKERDERIHNLENSVNKINDNIGELRDLILGLNRKE